jgi:hypothetical protein
VGGAWFVVQVSGWWPRSRAELEQVVSAAQQLPLGRTGPQTTAHEPPAALDGLDLPEDRFDGPAAQGVAGLALGIVQLGPHRRPQVVALGFRWLAIFAGLAMAAMAGRGDQQLRRLRDGRHIGDRPMAGVGCQALNRVADAGGGQGGTDGGQHRGQLLEVVGLLGQFSSDDHLGGGGGCLGVVALQGAAVAAYKAAVGVGGVDRRLGVGSLIAPPRSDVGAGSLAAGPGGQLGDPLLVALLAGGGLGFQLGLGVSQPGQPLGPTSQRLRQLVAAGGAVLLVLRPIRLSGLLEQLSDLRLERGTGAVGRRGGVGLDLGAIQGEQP